MSKSFARHYHSYKYIPWALALFIFAFAIIFNLIGGFLSDGVPTGMAIAEDGQTEGFPLLWLLMHFMMLSLMFIVIVLVSFAWDAKKEPRQFIRKKTLNRDILIEKRKQEAKSRFHRHWRSGFSKETLRESLLEKGHDRNEVEKLLDEHIK